jgi:DAPG hydrolase PhiG domain
MHPLLKTLAKDALVTTLATAALCLFQAADLMPGTAGVAHAQAATVAPIQFTLGNVRPEALSWWWDNADEATLKSANWDIRAFVWEAAPASPQHLGYSAGAQYRSTASWGGTKHVSTVTHVDPQALRGRVATDNFLGAKPYSFVAQSVSVDGKPPFLLLVQYNAVGATYSDTRVQIDVSNAADPALAKAYAEHLRKTLTGLRPKLMDLLNERYFNAVLKKRGSYTIGPVDKDLNVRLSVTQEIKGINAEMLAWWWDHIGNTERYRLWQPIDHISFEWTVPPNSPDVQYDIGAVQKAKESIGKTALTLNITGADPKVIAPAADLVDADYFHATADPTALGNLLPHNVLTHQWRPNATGDGVILSSTFVNTSLARVLNATFFEDLGSHALREFQMLPYFLPRLYRREHLHQ